MMAILMGVGLAWSLVVHQTSLRLELTETPSRLSTSDLWVSLPLIAITAPIAFMAFLPFQIATSLSVFAFCCLAIAYWDVTSLRVPRLFSAGAAIIGLLFCAYQYPDRLLMCAVTMMAAFILLEVARFRFLKQRGYAGLGGGDPAAFAALIAWIGPFAGLWTLALGSLLAFGLALIRAQRIPMASVLVLAAWVVIFTRKAMGYDVLWDMGRSL